MTKIVQSDDPEVWVDAGGEPHRIESLGDFHLLNVIGFLRRRAQTYAGQHGIDSEALLQRIPQYPRLLAEVSKRGLGVVRSDAAKANYERFSGLIMGGRDGE